MLRRHGCCSKPRPSLNLPQCTPRNPPALFHGPICEGFWHRTPSDAQGPPYCLWQVYAEVCRQGLLPQNQQVRPKVNNV